MLAREWKRISYMYSDRDERIERPGLYSSPLHITSQHEWDRADAKFSQVMFNMIAKEPLKKGEPLTCHMPIIDLYEIVVKAIPTCHIAYGR